MLNLNTIKKFIQNTNLKTIKDKTELAMFLAQCDHESQGFTRVSENFNYSNHALLTMFGKYFTENKAQECGRTYGIDSHAAKQEMIANIIYEKRMGNDDYNSGEGWKFRGRGYIQITGKNNYAACGIYLKILLIDNPDLLCQPQNAMNSAIWFWNKSGCALYGNNIEAVTKKINGGLNGLMEREFLFQEYKILLK